MDLEVLIENTLNALAAGITIGCIYGLMCIGLGLIFGIMRIVNFAQGELLMLGMYASLYLVTGGGVLAFLGPYFGPFVGALLRRPDRVRRRRAAAQVPDRARLRPAHRGQHRRGAFRPADRHAGHLADPAEWRPDPVRLDAADGAHAARLQRLRGRTGFYGDATVFLNKARLIACAVAIITAITLYLVLEYTRLGKSLRAAADNPTAATYMGIDVDRAYRIAFALGCGITAVAGGLMATYLSFGPFIGLDYVIIMYSGVVLGGMGSILGAFWGGLTVGFVQQCSALVLPPQLQNAAIFVVFLMIVMLRPQGLFGRSAERA